MITKKKYKTFLFRNVLGKIYPQHVVLASAQRRVNFALENDTSDVVTDYLIDSHTTSIAQQLYAEYKGLA